MNKLKHSCALLLLALSVSYFSHAQYFSVRALGGVGIPMGGFAGKPTVDVANNNFVGTADVGGGADLQLRYHMNENTAIGLNLGYMNFAGKPFPSLTNSGSFVVIPIMAAFDYYFLTDADAFRPYIGLEAGFVSSDVKYTTTTGNKKVTAAGSGVGFAPVLGAIFNFSDHVGLIANVKYMYALNEHKYDITKNSADASDVGTPETTYLALNLGLNFTFGNK